MVYIFMTHIGEFPKYPLHVPIPLKSTQELLDNVSLQNVFFLIWFLALPNVDQSSLSQSIPLVQL